MSALPRRLEVWQRAIPLFEKGASIELRAYDDCIDGAEKQMQESKDEPCFVHALEDRVPLLIVLGGNRSRRHAQRSISILD
jgi:hypothetical protein